MIKDIKVIFFDLDMTLWDHIKAQKTAIGKLCSIYKLDSKIMAPVYERINEKYWQIFMHEKISVESMRVERFRETLIEIGAEYLDPQEVSSRYLELYPEDVFLIAGAENILKYLHQHFKIGILTNGFRDTQLKKTQNAGLDKYIDWFVAIDDADSCKPHPEFFEYAVKLCGYEPENICLVGDSLEIDVAGGQNVGWKTVWLNRDDITLGSEDIRPDAVIRDLHELPDILELTEKN